MAPLCGRRPKNKRVYLFASALASLASGHPPLPGLPRRPMDERSAFALTPDDLRRRFERALAQECDLDPMILRARQLRHQGSLPHARSLEQELLPLF